MRPALACLKIVILETVNISASSFAVRARSIRSIRSASDNGTVLLLELHDSIYLLTWIYVRGYCRNCIAYFYIFLPLYLYSGPIPSRCRQSVNHGLPLLRCARLMGLAGLSRSTAVTYPSKVPIPAVFAHIRQRDTPAGLLTPVSDVPTRKMTAVYRFRVRDERPDLRRLRILSTSLEGQPLIRRATIMMRGCWRSHLPTGDSSETRLKAPRPEVAR